MVSEKFNQGWKFWEDKNAFALVWNIPEHAREIDLPHDAMIEVKPKPESLNKGNTGYRDGGVYNYVKLFDVPSDMKDQAMVLKFEGIYMNSFIYINGELAAKCPYGYTTFEVELDKYVRYGEQNEIRVLVRNSGMPNSRWYAGGGIYRDVYLLTGDRCHIASDGVQISTENVYEKHAVISVKTKVNNKRAQSGELTLKTAILNDSDEKVTEEITPIALYEREERVISKRISVREPKLWDSENPNLYKCISEIYEGEQLIDQSITTFGIRTLTLDSIQGLKVNGKTVNLRGACIHDDSGVIGVATYDEVKYRQVKKLKEAGFNAIRMSHHPMAQSMLRACDELGVYVMDEAFDMWSRCKSDHDYALHFEEWWEADVEAMVKKDFNHPSVIMYSLGNEIPELGNRYGVSLSHKMSEKVKELDPTRYTLISVNGVFAAGDHVGKITRDVVATLAPEEVSGDVNNFMTLMEDHMDKIVCHEAITKVLEGACATTDIAGYNYMAARYESDGENYPNRVIVGSETYPPEIGRNWQLVEKLPHVIGDFTWTGWDYIGEAGVGIPAYEFGEGGFGAQYPCQLAYCGDFDLIGQRRPASYYREIVFGFRKEPYIVIHNPYKDSAKLRKTPWIISDGIPSWSWEIEEGEMVTVEIYAPGDSVELLVNGESLGKKVSGAATNYMTYFEVPYRKGQVEAVVYEGNEEVARHTLKTYDDTRKLEVTYDKSREREFVFVEIKVVDGSGQLVIGEDEIIKITTGDSMKLLGFGSGDPKTSYAYDGEVTKTYQGTALAILKCGCVSADTVIHIEGEKLGPKELKIQ